MSYRPFVPAKTENQDKPPAIVAIPATVREYPAQVIATELRHSATVTAEKVEAAETVANNRRTIATGNADKTGTVATIATVASLKTENEIDEEALQERAGILMDNGIPQEQADGLALALHLLQLHPQAEAALCWLIDNRNQEENRD